MKKGNPRQNTVDVGGRALPWPHTRNEATVTLHIVRQLIRIHDDGGIKVRKENDHHPVEEPVEERVRGEVCPHALHQFTLGPELRQRARKKHDRLGEDNGNDSRCVDSKRYMGSLATVYSAPHDSLGVLNGNPTLPLSQ